MMASTTPNTFNPEIEAKVSETFAGPIDQVHEPSTPQRLTFDSLKTWEMLIFADREMMITAKGDAVHPEFGRHILLDAMDKKQPQRVVIHESWINFWLDIRGIITPVPSSMRRDD